MRFPFACIVTAGVLVSATSVIELRSASDDLGNHVYAHRNAALLSYSSAREGSGLHKRSSTDSACPEIWNEVAADLKRAFDGCSRRASTAIRFAFHDAGGYSSLTTPYGAASGGADGSLLLSDTEIARSDHNPMQGFREWLLSIYHEYKDRGIGAADLVQVSGALAVRNCPGGPVVKTVIGRTDDSTAAPEKTLPPAFGEGADYESLVQLFAAKGINTRELAALMGAHTVSRSFAEMERGGIPWGMSQDSSPQIWDNKYYSEVQNPVSSLMVASFESDVNLANSATDCGKAFSEFAGDSEAWDNTYQGAMHKLSLLGVTQGQQDKMIDCTHIID